MNLARMVPMVARMISLRSQIKDFTGHKWDNLSFQNNNNFSGLKSSIFKSMNALDLECHQMTRLEIFSGKSFKKLS
jgi:hypothetical protein